MLSHWLDLSNRAESSGPLAVATDSAQTDVDVDVDVRTGVHLIGHGRVVAVLDGRDLVDLLVEGPRALRTLIAVFSAEWNAHSPMGGWCRECARPMPCPTRTRLASILAADFGGVG
ncbi:hypothetical protein SAMN04489730_0160 [Amycolatopsis australiensis]|uniref:Uncharacterized protein n=1 Tax=Amycolatopsis australiensis TaxID=546364 RepID=A0A1K1LRB4_9PSEU|nr:hypothetical protein SAMN04489730_0160 [Amycolatopsis australiensis]